MSLHFCKGSSCKRTTMCFSNANYNTDSTKLPTDQSLFLKKLYKHGCFLMAKQVTIQSKYFENITLVFLLDLQPNHSCFNHSIAVAQGIEGRLDFTWISPPPPMAKKKLSGFHLVFTSVFTAGVQRSKQNKCFCWQSYVRKHPTPPTSIHLKPQNDLATCWILVLLSGGYLCPASHFATLGQVKTRTPLEALVSNTPLNANMKQKYGPPDNKSSALLCRISHSK